MLAIQEIRALHGERRNLIECPGHLLDAGKAETGIALVSLSASFSWSCYLYSPLANSTLYNWEGEIFDFWTDGDAAFAAMKEILMELSLEET